MLDNSIGKRLWSHRSIIPGEMSHYVGYDRHRCNSEHHISSYVITSHPIKCHNKYNKSTVRFGLHKCFTPSPGFQCDVRRTCKWAQSLIEPGQWWLNSLQLSQKPHQNLRYYRCSHYMDYIRWVSNIRYDIRRGGNHQPVPRSIKILSSSSSTLDFFEWWIWFGG